MAKNLQRVLYFEEGTYPYKYRAYMNNGKTVSFGHQDYEHYRDSVPKRLGGGIWDDLDHLDKERRRRYRARHSNVKKKDGRFAYRVKYSPSWFSYYYLW